MPRLFILLLLTVALGLFGQEQYCFAQGANAFGPGLSPSNGQNSQGNQSQSGGQKKGQKKKSTGDENSTSNQQLGTDEAAFSDDGAGGDGEGFNLPGGNQTGNDFFDGGGEATNVIPPSTGSAFNTSSGSGTGSNPSAQNVPAQQVVPEVEPITQTPSANNQAPAAALPNASPTPALQPSVSNVPQNASVPPPVGGAQAAPPPVETPPPPPPIPPPTASPPPIDPPEVQAPTFKVVIPDAAFLPDPTPNDFSGAPPTPGTMRQVADGEAPETYIVQRGDTLFDICDQLIDEKSYWPKLWSLNPSIKNPHFIFPSTKLRFYPGDSETPPYLQVVNEDDVVPIDKGSLDESELVADTVPPPAAPAAEAVPEAPRSSVIEVVGPDQLNGDLAEAFMDAGQSYRNNESSVEVPGFIFAEEKEPKGIVLGGRYGEISLAAGQRATIESEEGLRDGSLLTVLRKSKKIVDPEAEDFVGNLYYYVGTITVIKQIEQGLYSAQVESTRLSIRPDDLVVDYISVKRSVPLDIVGVPRSEIDSNIVAFEYDEQVMGAQGQTVFIDRGSQDGVSPGMYLSIYQTPRNLSPDSRDAGLPEDYGVVGLMRIIDVTAAGSVGYILQNSHEIKLADKTKKP